jgi:hypothetical protein
MSKQILIVIALALTVIGCSSQGDDGGGSGDDVAESPDAGRPMPPAIDCEAIDNGCECSDLGIFEDQLAECSALTVASGGSTGYCCDSSYCSCHEVGCYQQIGIDRCTCGSATVRENNGYIVDACFPVNNGVCCFNETLQTCDCGSQCYGGDREVASCTVADIAFCDVGDKVAVCK